MPDRRPVEFRIAAGGFDADWYRHAYPDIDGRLAGTATAFGHYVEVGFREGRRPNRDFEPDWYLERYPKVAGAIAAGRIAGAFHDSLLRAEQGMPRRAAPASAVVAAALEGADPGMVAALARLTDRAPGWEFWLLAPPGSLPAEGFGPHVRLAASIGELPPVDLWLGRRDGDGPGATPTVALPPLLDRFGAATADREAAAIDDLLERLRTALLAGSPVIPSGRRDSGPVYVDPTRTAALTVSLRALPGRAPGAGAVLRAPGRILAELASGAAAVDLDGASELWVDLAAGLTVDFARRERSVGTVDVILSGPAGRAAWRRSLQAVRALRPAGRLTLVAPPPGLDVPGSAAVLPTRAVALAARRGPALLVPAGTALLPQAIAQAVAGLEAGVRRATSRPAIRHPDGHLAEPADGALAHDPDHLRRWRRAGVTLLSAVARRLPRQSSGSEEPSPLDAIPTIADVDVSAWPAPFAVLPALAPDWLQLDCRPDGAVLGRLRLRGAGLAAGGTVLIAGTTVGALAEPCAALAARQRPRTAGVPLGRLTLPASAGFAWPIRLPPGTRSSDILAIAPEGRWLTAQDGADPRPLLFRVESVRYRPPDATSSRPSADSRAR